MIVTSEKVSQWLSIGEKVTIFVFAMAMTYINANYAKKSDISGIENSLRRIESAIEIGGMKISNNNKDIEILHGSLKEMDQRIRNLENRARP